MDIRLINKIIDAVEKCYCNEQGKKGKDKWESIGASSAIESIRNWIESLNDDDPEVVLQALEDLENWTNEFSE